MDNINLSNYDFVDFGSSRGGCIDFAMKKLGGKRGLGVEIHKGRADKLIEEGYSCINADVTTLKLPKKSVKFVTMSHFLEHLISLEKANYAIELAVKTATDFVFIEGPTFDFDAYLKDKGFKFFWSDWTGHALHITTPQLKDIFTRLNLSFTLLIEQPYIIDSASPDIQLVGAPQNQHQYNLASLKKTVTFKKQLYRSFIFFVWLKKIEQREKLLNSRIKFIAREDTYRW